jgi:hypothetical protein
VLLKNFLTCTNEKNCSIHIRHPFSSIARTIKLMCVFCNLKTDVKQHVLAYDGQPSIGMRWSFHLILELVKVRIILIERFLHHSCSLEIDV